MKPADLIVQCDQGNSIFINRTGCKSRLKAILCRNGIHWLSASGWEKKNKYTYLVTEPSGDKTKIVLPKSFLDGMQSGDQVHLQIPSIKFSAKWKWNSKGKSKKVEEALPANVHDEAIKSNKQDFLANIKTRLSIFGTKSESIGQNDMKNEHSKINKAKKIVEQSSSALLDAKRAAREAELKVQQAAEMAEKAKKMEQEKIEASKEASKILEQAEITRKENLEAAEMARKMKMARLEEEERCKEIARCIEKAEQLEARRVNEITSLRSQASHIAANIAIVKSNVTTLGIDTQP